jgi:hypothetical protein
MPDSVTSDENVLRWALGGIASFAALIVAWIMRRESIRDDRDYEARKAFTGPLSELPAKLDVLIDRVERLEKRISEDRP